MTAKRLPEPVPPPKRCDCEHPVVDARDDALHCTRCGHDLQDDRRRPTADEMLAVLVRYIHERHDGHLGPGVMDTEPAGRLDPATRLFMERLATLGVGAILGPPEPLPPPKEWSSPEDLAARWGTSRWSVYRRKDAIGFRRRGRLLEASREAVERYERDGR